MMSKFFFDFCFVLFGNDHSTPCVDDGGQSTYELVCEHCASFAEVVSALDEAAMIRSYYASEFSSLLGGFDGTEGK
jgi:hypothetical protein